jgi:hypothetical protein
MTRLELALIALLAAASCYVGAATYPKPEPALWVDYAPGCGL